MKRTAITSVLSTLILIGASACSFGGSSNASHIADLPAPALQTLSANVVKVKESDKIIVKDASGEIAVDLDTLHLPKGTKWSAGEALNIKGYKAADGEFEAVELTRANGKKYGCHMEHKYREHKGMHHEKTAEKAAAPAHKSAPKAAVKAAKPAEKEAANEPKKEGAKELVVKTKKAEKPAEKAADKKAEEKEESPAEQPKSGSSWFR